MTTRLYCFPPAGGAATPYVPWAAGLAPAIDVRWVGYPADRPTDVPALARAVLAELGPLPDRYALFGHSMGALVAYEVARLVPDPGPVLLIACAEAAPSDRPAAGPPEPDEVFLRQLRADRRLPAALREEEELLRRALPTLRADFAAAAAYRPEPGPPLRCPMLAVGGGYDSDVERDGLAAWGRLTTGGCTVRLVPTGHDVPGEDPGALRRIVAAELAPPVPVRPTPTAPRPVPSGAVGPRGEQLREAVRALLRRPDLAADIDRCRSADPDADLFGAVVYREVGRRGWLAAHWPVEYGGRGLPLTDAAAVAEELVLHGVPDTPRVNSIDNTGATLLRAGTPWQRRAFLPGLAAGTSFASVLYSEPGAGSDLSAVRCTATRVDGGWTLSGTKAWNAKSAGADHGICLARTGTGHHPYAGLTLFLVPLRERGVTVARHPALNDEPLCTVELDAVQVDDRLRVGATGEAWPLVTSALAMERTGVNYAARARRWWQALASVPSDRWAGELAALEPEVTAAVLLAWEAISAVAAGPESCVIPAAKWLASETAARVGALATKVLVAGPALPADLALTLEQAARESPGLTLSAGTSEMMLNTVALDVPDLLDAPW